MSKREQAKEERRERIVEAAETLIRREGGVDFSMRELADLAGVAFAAAEPGEDPIEHFFEFVEGALGTYTSDSTLFRPLLVVVLSADAHPWADSISAGAEFWLRCLAPAIEAGLVSRDDDCAQLARSLHLGFRGALMGWARGEETAATTRRDLVHISGLLFAGAATVDARPRVEAALRRLESSPAAAR